MASQATFPLGQSLTAQGEMLDICRNDYITRQRDRSAHRATLPSISLRLTVPQRSVHFAPPSFDLDHRSRVTLLAEDAQHSRIRHTDP
jgi:hypothetical protein